MATLRWFAALLFFLGCLPQAYGQGRSPNGPPGPVGNPTPKGNPSPPSDTQTGVPLPRAPGLNSPEAESTTGALLKLPDNIFDAAGNVDPKLEVAAIKATANVGALSSVMSAQAQGEATALDNNIELRMDQIRPSLQGSGNVFLVEPEFNKEPVLVPRFGSWLLGSGIFSREQGTHSGAGILTAGVDTFISSHMAVGVLGSLLYSDSRVPGIKGNLLGDSASGGLYFGAWTGKPGFYVTASTLLIHTDFALLDSHSPNLINWTAFGSVGYQTSTAPFAWGPLVSVQFDQSYTNGFSLSVLQIYRNTTSSLQTRAGLYASLEVTSKLKLKSKLMWEHLLSSSSSLDVAYIGIPNSRQSIGSGPTARDSAWGSLSLEWRVNDRWNLQSSYSFDLGNNLTVQQVDLGVNASF